MTNFSLPASVESLLQISWAAQLKFRTPNISNTKKSGDKEASQHPSVTRIIFKRYASI